jgi:small subunit ribosomal protein S1
MQQLEKGTILDGTVSGLATFGAFVDIGVGRDGLVHISELSDGRVGKVEDAVEVGQKVKVRVLEVDPNSKRISLTMRLEDRPERPEQSDTERPPRAERNNPERFERGAASSRTERERPAPRPQQSPVRETIADPEEEVQGNATLEDLVSKFGGGAANRRDKKRRQDDEEEDTGDRHNRRQRDAIRRTLQQMDDE